MRLLHVKPARYNVFINNDAGSGARQDLATWKPSLESGWFYLGPGANNGNGAGTTGVIVRETGEGRVLVPITDWEMVWNDAGSGKPTDYALWRGVPAEEDRRDYVCLSSFFTRSHSKPSVDDSRGIRAIRRDLLTSADARPEIWTDAGTGAKADGSVWGVSTGGNVHALDSGAFIAAVGHNRPPPNVFCLDRNKIDLARDE